MQAIIGAITDLIQMDKNKIIKISIFAISLVIMLEQTMAFCIIEGYVLGKDGSLVDDAEVEIINLANNISFEVKSIEGLYVMALQDCIVDKDSIKISASYNGLYGNSNSIAKAPVTEINITLLGEKSAEHSAPPAGGAGGGGVEEKIIKEKPKECESFKIRDKKEFKIGLCDKGTYDYKGIMQEFSLVSFNRQAIIGIFSPLDSPIILYYNQQKEFDLDRNGANDLKAGFVDIEGDYAILVFEKIKEIFPKKPVEEKPKVEEPKPAKLEPRIDPNTLFILALVLVVIANIIWLTSQLRRHLEQ